MGRLCCCTKRAKQNRSINKICEIRLFEFFWRPSHLSLQCAQAGGEHPLLRGSPGQPEAHWLLPEVSIRWRTPRPRQEKECQEGPGWSWRSRRWGGRLRWILPRKCVLILPVLSKFSIKNVWSDHRTEMSSFFSWWIFVIQYSFLHFWCWFSMAIWSQSCGQSPRDGIYL